MGPVQWETASGRYWAPESAAEDYVGRLTAEISGNVYDLGFLTGSDGQAVVLDCGANVGSFSRLAIASGAGSVISFDRRKTSLIFAAIWNRKSQPAGST